MIPTWKYDMNKILKITLLASLSMASIGASASEKYTFSTTEKSAGSHGVKSVEQPVKRKIVTVIANSQAEALNILVESGLYNIIEPSVLSGRNPLDYAQPVDKPSIEKVNKSAAKSAVLEPAATPNDPYFLAYQYSYMHSSAAKSTIGHFFMTEWERSLSSQSKKTRVAVIDGGFGKRSDINYSKDNGASFVDSQIDNSPYLTNCDYAHGTNVASVIAATQNDGITIFGAANNVEIIPVNTSSCSSEAWSTDIAKAILWASGATFADEGIEDISKPADVINISQNGNYQCYSYLQEAIDYADSKGITVVVSAGNASLDTAISAPANCKHVVAVAASDTANNAADFTNIGRRNDIIARGTDIYGLGMYYETSPNQVYTLTGTSFSAPLVSAAVANLKSVTDGLTAAEVRYLLGSTTTAFDNNVTNCTVGVCGEGFLNNDQLLKAGRLFQSGDLSYIKPAIADVNECNKALLYKTFADELPLCGLFDLTINALEIEKEHITYNVYRSPIGVDIIPGESSTELFIANTQKVSHLISSPELNAYHYGFSVCYSGECGDDIIRLTSKNSSAICPE